VWRRHTQPIARTFSHPGGNRFADERANAVCCDVASTVRISRTGIG